MQYTTPASPDDLRDGPPTGRQTAGVGESDYHTPIDERFAPYLGDTRARGGIDASPGATMQPSWRADRVDEARPSEANHLLRLLARYGRAEYDALLPLLEPVAQERETVLYEPGQPLSHAYFPRTSVCSILKVMADGRRVEVGTTGFEGMAGLPIVLGGVASPFQCIVQLPGSAWRVSAATLREAAACGTLLHQILQCYAQYLFDQAAHSAACNRLHTVDERCARWLLIAHDRVGRAERFPLTQEFLAIMLGVRRASVSLAAETLQREGRIRYRRGSVTVADRAGLEAAACECYGTDRADYHRLLGGGGSWAG